MKKNGINLVIEELKQRLIAKKTEVKRYEQRISQFRQNQLFQVNQKQVYKDLNGEKQGDRIIPNSEDSIKFWSDIWSIRKEHNQHAEWLKKNWEHKQCRKSWSQTRNGENAGRSLTGKFLKVVCKDIGWKTLNHCTPECSSAAKLHSWWRKTLAKLDDLW